MTDRRNARPLSLVALFGLLAACGNEPSGGTTSGTGSGAGAGSGSGPTSTTAAPGSSGRTGVAECDDYLVKMRACIKDGPAEEQAARNKSIDMIEEQWKQSARSAVSKQQVVTACRAALDEWAKSCGQKK